MRTYLEESQFGFVIKSVFDYHNLMCRKDPKNSKIKNNVNLKARQLFSLRFLYQ